jgi:hypothetical protein
VRLERIFHLGENNASIFRTWTIWYFCNQNAVFREFNLTEENALTGAESVDDFGRVDLEDFDELCWIWDVWVPNSVDAAL